MVEAKTDFKKTNFSLLPTNYTIKNELFFITGGPVLTKSKLFFLFANRNCLVLKKSRFVFLNFGSVFWLYTKLAASLIFSL